MSRGFSFIQPESKQSVIQVLYHQKENNKTANWKNENKDAAKFKGS